MSLLEDVREFCDIETGSSVFDVSLCICINTALAILSDNGIDNPPAVKDTTSQWTDIIPVGKYFEDVKSYVCIKAKLLFDPPANSNIFNALSATADEALWRVSRRTDEISDSA